MKIARLAALAAMVGAAATAQAQTIQFTGSNTGCFYTDESMPCTPSAGSNDAVVDGHGLTYLGSTFDAFTSDGFLGVGNAPTSPNFNNLGSFALANVTYNYSTNPMYFLLQTTFTSPTDATAIFTSQIFGSVRSNGAGGVSIVFEGGPQDFTYANGSFTYGVNNLAVLNGKTVAVTGQIMATESTVPEPSSMALLGTGLVGLVPMLRRRK